MHLPIIRQLNTHQYYKHQIYSHHHYCRSKVLESLKPLHKLLSYYSTVVVTASSNSLVVVQYYYKTIHTLLEIQTISSLEMHVVTIIRCSNNM